MQPHAVSKFTVCGLRLETSHTTGLQHFPESLGTARKSPTGYHLQSKPRRISCSHS